MTCFCNPSPLYRCCSSARCPFPSVFLCFPSQHIDTVDSKKSPSSALPPQHIDTIAALPLLPVAIVARYFSIPESCGVPHLFAASVTHQCKLLPLLLHLHKQSFPLFLASFGACGPAAESDDGVLSLLHEAVFLVLHSCRINLDEQWYFRDRVPSSTAVHSYAACSEQNCSLHYIC
ncbi:hypothetical protein BHM03_00031161 [Ensete ventricosum]|nr:hypothetical protein BHM03_00031161 [Ensete ventricosum]